MSHSESFNSSAEDIKSQYRLAFKSRQVSLHIRLETLTGKAKFGIYGAGRELALIALAHQFKQGDYYSGYYRDQSLMLALNLFSTEQIFAQLYAHSDASFEPSSAGRMMVNHFATDFLDEDIPQANRFNVAAFLSPIASQIPKVIGLGHASQLYNFLDIPNKRDFSKGDEITFASLGNGACAQGIFWESLTAIALQQLPVVLSIWDDGYSISVDNDTMFPGGNLLKLLSGFTEREGEPGFQIISVKGWDYKGLFEAYELASSTARLHGRPSIIYVYELTQPLGHSTSGSHERYKSKERLSFEQEFDCLIQFRKFVLQSGALNSEQLDALELEVKTEVRGSQRAAWSDFMSMNQAFKVEVFKMLERFSYGSPLKERFERKVEGISDFEVSDLFVALDSILTDLRIDNHIGIEEIEEWRRDKIKFFELKAAEHFYNSESLQLDNIPARFNRDSRMVDGREVINTMLDLRLERDQRIVLFGEDVAKIGGVNQTFAGLQFKYGNERVFDTGIRERTLIGQGIGLAMRGLRPIVDIQYLDYLLSALQLLSDDLATLRWRTGGKQSAPVIISTRGHRLEGIWHSGSPMAALLSQLRGMNVLVPRDMTQASAFYNYLLDSPDPDPSIIIEPLNGYRLKERLPDNVSEFRLSPGTAEIRKSGTDITVVSYGSTLRIVEDAADIIQDLSLEIIDVQSLIPFDLSNLILDSVKKTGHLILIDEDLPGGATAFMYQQILEDRKAFQYLKGEVLTITAKDHRTAYGKEGDFFGKPNVVEIKNKILKYALDNGLRSQISRIDKVISNAKTNGLFQLNLSSLKLTGWPVSLFDFKALKELDLSYNQLSNVPVNLSDLYYLESLNLSSNLLKGRLEGLRLLPNLKRLIISNNDLKEFPLDIHLMINLEELDLSGNDISEIPLSLFTLSKLRKLKLDNNQIDFLPAEIRNLENLVELSIIGNPIANVQPEILFKDVSAIFGALEGGHDIVYLKEAKIILCGQANVGKTHVVSRLIDDTFSESRQKTDGIEIRKWRLHHEGDFINYKIWDFGGQEVYHATHRFFLTKNSIYVLVWDAQIGEHSSRLNYWLHVINTISEHSPIIVVQNKTDLCTEELNNQALKKQFSNIVKFVDFSSQSGQGKKELTDLINGVASSLSGFNRPWPVHWASMRRKLLDLAKAYITLDEFLEICAVSDIEEKTGLELLELLNEIGDLIYFSDDYLLSKVVFLSPSWLTGLTYAILDSKELKTEKGNLKSSMLYALWGRQVSSDISMVLIQLMKKFDLLFEKSYNNYVVPVFLPTLQLEVNWDYANNQRYEYSYDVLPAGIFSGFIAREHHIIKEEGEDLLCWRNLVVLEKRSGLAMVMLNELKRTIEIRCGGQDRANMLSMIRQTFEEINLNYDGIRIEEKILCNCHPDCTSAYLKDNLYNLLEKKTNVIWCSFSNVEVVIENLLYGIERYVSVSAQNATIYYNKKDIKIFVSYSSKDARLRTILLDGLKEHLSNKLKVNYNLWSDLEINHGADWREKIELALKESNVALLLVSPGFANSSFIKGNELPHFLAQQAHGRCLILPVLIRDYDFSEFQEIAKINFFKTYFYEYGMRQNNKDTDFLPFSAMAQYPETFINEINLYCKKLAEHIHTAVKAHLNL